MFNLVFLQLAIQIVLQLVMFYTVTELYLSEEQQQRTTQPSENESFISRICTLDPVPMVGNVGPGTLPTWAAVKIQLLKNQKVIIKLIPSQFSAQTGKHLTWCLTAIKKIPKLLGGITKGHTKSKIRGSRHSRFVSLKQLTTKSKAAHCVYKCNSKPTDCKNII